MKPKSLETWTETVFMFPSSFNNGVVRPFHLAKLERLIASLSFHIFKGKNEVFYEGEIFWRDELVKNNTARI